MNYRKIHVFDLKPDGSVANQRTHYDFGDVRGADGMSIDTQGNLYASAGSGATKNTGIHVISPAGKLVKIMPIPEDPISNNAFGGPDMKTLYVTSLTRGDDAGALLSLRVDVAGVPIGLFGEKMR